MSEQLQLRRGTAAQVAAFTGAQGEVIVDTTNNRAVISDGATMGGWPAAKLAEVLTNARTAVSDAAYMALTTDRTIAFTALTAARIVTLPASSAYPTGTTLTVLDETGNCSATTAITLSRAGSDTIDGATSAAISSAYGFLALQSNGGGKWTIVDQATSNLGPVGIGTAADPNNPLSVYGAAALFNGTNFNITVNKAAAGDTASLIFEDGFSGRAQMGLNGSDNFSFKVSPNGSSWTTAIALDAATGAATFAHQRTAVADAAYSALVTDRLIAFTALTAARVVSLPAAASYPAGQSLTVIDESGNCSSSRTVTLTPIGSDTINGLTSVAIASGFGAVMLESNGSNAWTVVKRAGGANVLTFSSSGTYTPSPGISACDVYLIGGGGGGGGGCLQAASIACSGGAGGGGGGTAFGSFTAAEVGASQTVAIGAGGAAGAAATTSGAAGGTGGYGGYTTFGSLLTAYSAGPGAGGQLASSSGGGSGGNALSGGVSGSSAAGGGSFAGGGSGGYGAVGGLATAPFASAGGGGGAVSSSTAGGYAVCGPSGGGSGGGISAANAVSNGGNGGANIGGAGPAGGSGAGASGVSPSLSSRALNLFFGSGAAGGASSLAAAFPGGAGGSPGGGGGGGGSAQNGGTAGAGGGGGVGYCIIVEHF